MKVGILTFHNAYNYGAILQTYATQEIIKGYGHDVDVINYHNKEIDNAYNQAKFHFRNLPKKKFYRIPQYLLSKYYYWRRRKEFGKFINRFIKLSPLTYYQGDSIVFDEYDMILIGSDQVWNKNITGGFDDVYWGNFQTKGECRKIAWSVCMNNTKLNDEDELYILTKLSNFDKISVREDNLQRLLSDLSKIRINHTLDPTMMLPTENWVNLCHQIKEKNYIVVYAVDYESNTISFARKLSQKLRKKIIIIRSYSKFYFTPENKEYAGPIDFISLIRYSDYVVSTSYHGTVFSLIFKKQFVCPAFDKNVRIESLLKCLGLSERIVYPYGEPILLPEINYLKIEVLLNELRKNTSKFLDDTLL